MKKWILLICAVLLTAVLLCGCMERTGEALGDDMATIASEIKDNVDSMIENGTVGDRDGYIGEEPSASEAPTDPSEDVTEDMTTEDDILDADPTENTFI